MNKMSKNERMRWRKNPETIGVYYTGEKVPSNLDVHLKPNEACVVIENGIITGVASATKIEVNPEQGFLSSIFKKEPHRAFLFMHTGPHELLLKVEGNWSNGEKGKGIAGVKISFDPDKVGKMLDFPSKGITEISIGDITRKIEMEFSSQFASKFMSRYEANDASNNQDAIEMIDAGLRSEANTILSDFGAIVDRVWLNWNESDYERLLRKQNDLENMKREGKIDDQINEEQIRREVQKQKDMLNAKYELKVALDEFDAKMKHSQKVGEAKARSKAEQGREDAHAELLRSRRLRDEETNKEVKENTHKSKLEDLEREKEKLLAEDEFLDLKEELEHKRRLKDLERQLEFANLAAKSTGFFDED